MQEQIKNSKASNFFSKPKIAALSRADGMCIPYRTYY